MQKGRILCAGTSALILASCGGGGSSGGGNAPPVAGPTPPPTLSVTLSQSEANVVLVEGEEASFSFDASYSGSSTQSIVADVEIGGRRYELDGSVTASGNSFTVNLKTLPFAAGGETSTDVTFRLCISANCSTVYPGSTQTFRVNLNVQLADWETFQRNAEHTGYVAVSYDTSDFANAWEIATGTFQPTPVAATAGQVFYNIRTGTRRMTSQALNSVDGSNAWSVDLGSGTYLGPPSYNGGRVISASMDSSSFALPIQILNSETGNILGTVQYASQFATPPALTPYGDEFFLQSGYFGNVVFSWDAVNAARNWDVEPNGPGGMGFIMEGQSVAVDNDYVYYYGISGLYILDRATGATSRTIADPFFSMGGLSYFGTYYASPIIDGNGGIYAFSGNRGRGQALPINAYDFAAGNLRWRTGDSYAGEPALRGNQLYAIRARSAMIDVIDTATGAISSTIDASAAGRTALTSNIILTESHLFVATSSETLAIDLQDTSNPVVWTAPHGGQLALTPDNLLVVSAIDGVYAYTLF